MRRLSIIATALALTVFAIHGSQSPASAQALTARPFVTAPLLGSLTATHALVDAAPAWQVNARDREQRARFRMHDRHSSWLLPLPRSAVAPFGSDPLQRRHWWADPMLRRHWWD